MKLNKNKKNKWNVMFKEIMKFFCVTMFCCIGIYMLCLMGISLLMPIILDYVISLGITDISSLNACKAIIRIFFSLIPTLYLINRNNKYKKMVENISENNEIFSKQEMEIKLDNSYSLDKHKVIVDNIIVRYETLSRGRQMELLNYIKGDKTIQCLENGLDNLSEYGLNLLQNELENVLFPDFTELETDGYVKKREIRNNRY